jgi:hypothetical protein
MATAAIHNNPIITNRLGGRDGGFATGNNGNQRNLWTNQVSPTEGFGLGGANGNRVGSDGGGRRGIAGSKDTGRRELSGDEIEDPDEQPTKRIKVTEEVAEVSADFYGQIVGMLEGFQTKGTIWYATAEAEKKRDKSAFVLWKGRTKPDGTMTLSFMEPDRTVHEVIATEVSIAQQFKEIFDPNSASRIFELVGAGSNIQKAVFQTLREQNEGGCD